MMLIQQPAIIMQVLPNHLSMSQPKIQFGAANPIQAPQSKFAVSSKCDQKVGARYVKPTEPLQVNSSVTNQVQPIALGRQERVSNKDQDGAQAPSSPVEPEKFK